MKFDRKKLHRRFSLFLISSAVIACTFVQAFAVDDVRVTNWPTQYSVVNTTWDQRLSTLQTTLQTQSANISTLVNRFGWNGTYTFSQGFELLYNDVHNLASSTSGGDLLTAFNREFPSGQPSLGDTNVKSLLFTIRRQIAGTTTSTLSNMSSSLSSVDSYTQHIDSDIHALNTTVSAISSNISSIKTTANSIYSDTHAIYNLTNRHLPSIAVDVSNISVDTEHISDTQDTLVSQGAITMRNVGILREFFADDDTLAQKAAAKDASDSALNNFTGNGQSSASADDYSDIDWAVSDVKYALGTGSVSALDATSVMTGVDQTGWAWFSQATYDSINPAPTRGGSLNPEAYMAFYEEQLSSEVRKGSSDTPLLDGYFMDITKAVGK